MNYSRQEFFNLMEAVEDQGGEHLDRLCAARSYTFLQTRAEEQDNGGWKFVANGKNKVVTLPSCGNSALFTVPYAVTDEEWEKGDEIGWSGELTACAVEDDMGLWPRFKDQVAG